MYFGDHDEDVPLCDTSQRHTRTVNLECLYDWINVDPAIKIKHVSLFDLVTHDTYTHSRLIVASSVPTCPDSRWSAGGDVLHGCGGGGAR